MMLPEPNIILSVKNNDIAWLRRLLADGSVDVDEEDIGGWTALHQAVDHQNVEAIRLLLEHGGDPTLENGMGRTARDSASGDILTLIDAAILRREYMRACVRYRASIARSRREAAAVRVVVKRRANARVTAWRPWLDVRFRAPTAACCTMRCQDR